MSTLLESYLEIKTLVIQDLALLPHLVQVVKQMVQMINLALDLPQNNQ